MMATTSGTSSQSERYGPSAMPWSWTTIAIPMPIPPTIRRSNQ
jgi:hypothetical protein